MSKNKELTPRESRRDLDPEKKIVFLDMDGVLANFWKACPSGYRDEDHDCPIEMLRGGFFSKLEVMPGAKEAVNKLMRDERYDVWIGSKPSTKNLYCATEKFLWIEEHFPNLLRKVNLVTHKGLLRGHYLVDDDREWEKHFDGEFIWFDESRPVYSWNKVLHQLGLY